MRRPKRRTTRTDTQGNNNNNNNNNNNLDKSPQLRPWPTPPSRRMAGKPRGGLPDDLVEPVEVGVEVAGGGGGEEQEQEQEQPTKVVAKGAKEAEGGEGTEEGEGSEAPFQSPRNTDAVTT